ncbi:hypothetical protein PUN28_020620 [Cardiocondyla obscurior]|uniref:Transmembrane protein n=1 Tax=Cardiocondyla obscurior TaxID=286306 RepID=A0AAW2E4S8_9HYME
MLPCFLINNTKQYRASWFILLNSTSLQTINLRILCIFFFFYNQRIITLISYIKIKVIEAESIYQFLLQISLRPLEFCGMGMFYFGYKFIYKFFMWILTVIIFVLQMDSSPMSRIPNKINVTCFDRDV